MSYENMMTLQTSLMVRLGKNPFTSSTSWSCSILVRNCCNVWRFEPSPYSTTLYCSLQWHHDPKNGTWILFKTKTIFLFKYLAL